MPEVFSGLHAPARTFRRKLLCGNQRGSAMRQVDLEGSDWRSTSDLNFGCVDTGFINRQICFSGSASRPNRQTLKSGQDFRGHNSATTELRIRAVIGRAYSGLDLSIAEIGRPALGMHRPEFVQFCPDVFLHFGTGAQS